MTLIEKTIGAYLSSCLTPSSIFCADRAISLAAPVASAVPSCFPLCLSCCANSRCLADSRSLSGSGNSAPRSLSSTRHPTAASLHRRAWPPVRRPRRTAVPQTPMQTRSRAKTSCDRKADEAPARPPPASALARRKPARHARLWSQSPGLWRYRAALPPSVRDRRCVSRAHRPLSEPVGEFRGPAGPNIASLHSPCWVV